MSGRQMPAGYALGQKATNVKIPHIGLNKVKKVRRIEMKLSLKQRFRNWLMDTDSEVEADRGIYVEEDRLQSDGIRLQIYKASGGYVVETRGYDRKTDRNLSSMHVITESEDLGDRLSKIVMMEAMR